VEVDALKVGIIEGAVIVDDLMGEAEKKLCEQLGEL
jgi:hypothetical protein